LTASGVTRVDDVGGTQRRALAFDGRVRIAFVIFGGMVALQSSSTLDATKLLYLVGTALCLLGAVAAVWGARRTLEVSLRTPWIGVSAALAVLVAMSFLIARSAGTSSTDWLRDVAAYALFATVPIFAFDAEASTSRKLLVAMLIAAGFLGGLSWAVEWLSRRQILELPISRVVFPSPQLPSMLYTFAMAAALTAGPRRGAWAVLAGVVLGLFLLTGTRSSLLLLVGPLVMAVLMGRARWWTSVRSIALHGVASAAVILIFQLALGLGRMEGEPGNSGEPGQSAPAGPSTPSVVGDRFGSLPGVIGNLASDPSFKERLAQYEAAWALFVSSPVVGVGPGHPIEWIDVSGYPRTGWTADTPLVMPAKFGLLGILIFLGAGVAYSSTVLLALRRDRRSAITLTLVGFGVWTIVGLPLGFPVEDKGASLALMLLLALAFAERALELPRPLVERRD
jgi:hypothetical protein